MPEVPATESAFHSVLAAEQSMLQAVAGSTISEAGTRSLIYLSTLSSGLVAVGFAGGSPALLATLTFTVLPTIFMLGWFTVVRLVDNSVENITARRRISRIREHFASLHPLGPELIAADHPRNGELGIRYWYSWSQSTLDLYNIAGTALVSRLTYDGMNGHNAEVFGRYAHTNGFYAKSYLGGGWLINGRLTDEDFPPLTSPYSRTYSDQRDGCLLYTSPSPRDS